MRRWTRPLPAEPDRAILSHVWTTSTCYKPLEIERDSFATDVRDRPRKIGGKSYGAILSGSTMFLSIEAKFRVRGEWRFLGSNRWLYKEIYSRQGRPPW